MDLSFTPDEERFRLDVRQFLAEHLPPATATKVQEGRRLTREDQADWHAILAKRGWLASHWPVEHGGTGWSRVQAHIFDVEAALAYAPQIVPFGVSMLGPVLIRFGTEEQKAHWLPRILDGSDWWCQGYSEPGAGSDLASVKTQAVRDGDHYIVNGQKTWTTLGHFANMIFCLVRTKSGGKPQEGISFLLVDMNSPGVEVRPIITLDGEHEVNEVFFSDVRVPVGNLVGEENKGWTYAKYLLTYERTGMTEIGRSTASFARLRQLAETEFKNGRPLALDPLFSARMARLEIDLDNLRTTNLRVLMAAAQGAAPAAESSMLKIRGSEIRQSISNLARTAVGLYARPHTPAAVDDGTAPSSNMPPYAAPLTGVYLNDRKVSIYGGSNEVQRGIIAKTILEL
jgi:alkylation response protein AidB-like acyl-CoA dehydrogenase